MTGEGDSPLVGIVGGGQLGRMLALAGVPMGLRFRFLEPAPSPPVRDLGEVISGEYHDPACLDRLSDGAEVVTFEFENVPAAAVERLESRTRVFPSSRVLATSQDRLAEKEAFREAGIDVADFRAVGSRAELDRAVADLGLPAILKTRRLGYDGKGQWLLRESSDLEPAWLEAAGAALLLESFVLFQREISILVARGVDGACAFYPVTENEHRDGILRTSRAPAPDLDTETEVEARRIGARLAEALDYVGVLAVELFQVDGRLLANEIAPRVHNSGHWTQDGAVTSQFENHLRAVLGLPLGSTDSMGWSAMVNLVGELPSAERILAIPGAHLHLYGKTPRRGRKLGHVNLVAGSPEDLERMVRAVREWVP